MRLARWAFAALLALLSIPALAEVTLVPHTAQYDVKISIVSGVLNTELRRTAGGYLAHHVVRATGMSKLLTNGSMDVTSEFSSSDGELKPIRFHAIDTIKNDPDVDLRFDWSTNEVSGTIGEENVTQKLDGVVHDSVSIQYRLMSDLLNGGANDRYTLFDIEKLRVADVTNTGTKKVKTKAGTFVAVGIQHQKEGSSRTTTLWCVEELGYLPVIIEQHRAGKLKFRATLERYTPTPE
ncbi:MAG: DUF3108 domain-containing protein [Gammaproteobacteria bacterium]|nr:DUF3108 domain-containing protein [Gammaproteobacteria bacterium]MDH5239765.1 DUF3108 domain-containing protein [Gammaproteobacteria bacterium]MDH5260559.1 DUF3108 domain-containing protein [Gammaproteobacteria bacterium]MDH5582308.1 DUF3108 domain-containing protein [Gammaproteobacteria bacterium]